MKFTANEDFRLGRSLFEEGNTYGQAKYGVTDEQLERAWNRGWCEVEGWDKAPERQPGAATVQPQNTRITTNRSEG